MVVAILVLWPIIGGAVGAWVALAIYDFLFVFLRRAPTWRRFERSMTRHFRVRP